ncbi:MAG TPA: transporter [Pseudolabrys sp.]|nr:transporter [Pseudolabrys sp.]
MNRVKQTSIALSVLVVFTAVGAPVAAQTVGPANVDYSLFNPVPDDKLRELSTDRPGKSHSAITVDAGHFQIESDFLNYTYDPHGNGDITTRAYSIGTPILKLGVTNWMDVELGLVLFNSLHQSFQSSPGNSNWDVSAHGFGDTLLGTKINAFGNDGGDQSLAFLPFIKIPTASPGLGNGHVEFTLNVPYTIALSNPWSLTLEPNIGVLRNIDNTDYRGDYGFIANLNRPILVKGLTAAVEVAVDASSENKAGTKLSFDPSLQYLVNKNLQLDVGVYFGLNRATPRYNPYIGVSYRY